MKTVRQSKQTFSDAFPAMLALLLRPIGAPILSCWPCQLKEIELDVPTALAVAAGLTDLGGNSGGTACRDEGTLFLLLR